jgi:hypothetical protein
MAEAAEGSQTGASAEQQDEPEHSRESQRGTSGQANGRSTLEASFDPVLEPILDRGVIPAVPCGDRCLHPISNGSRRIPDDRAD